MLIVMRQDASAGDVEAVVEKVRSLGLAPHAIPGAQRTAIGITGGFLTGFVLNKYELIKLPADVYYLSHLPVKMQLSDFLTVSISAIVISFLATLYPAWQAAKLDPVEPLRYE